LTDNTTLFAQPLHPYTQMLMAAVPVPNVAIERSRTRGVPFGEMPSVINPPSGCRFRTRCPHARGACAESVPPLTEHTPGHWAACHFAHELSIEANAAPAHVLTTAPANTGAGRRRDA